MWRTRSRDGDEGKAKTGQEERKGGGMRKKQRKDELKIKRRNK